MAEVMGNRIPVLTVQEINALILALGAEFHEDTVLRSAVQKLIVLRVIQEDQVAALAEGRYA